MAAMRSSLSLVGLTVLSLSACRTDETVTAYGAADIAWRLVEIDGRPFPAQASLLFPEPGRLEGSTACNTFTGIMDAPYPWFDLQDLSVTEMACADLTSESQYLQALQDMTLSEVSGNTLILSNVAGREMLFTAAE